MSEIERDFCGFCNEVKPVNRKYIRAATPQQPLYGNQREFVIVKYCGDCGVQDDHANLLRIAEAAEKIANWDSAVTPEHLLDELDAALAARKAK